MANVAISHGELRGSDEGGVYSFKGIPFAAPISGEYRWLPPQQPAGWTGVRDATQFGLACPQMSSKPRRILRDAGRRFMRVIETAGAKGDDCLNLNVWTPTLDSNAKLPVMVWIHGGAFTTGAGSLPAYDGHNLAKKGVVYVTLNYRLGMMGSFTAPGMFDDDFCGANRGFEDQLAGLRWVQENIAAFGGDPEAVTIFGESAGGQSIASLIASPMAKGLFKRAIAQSGTPQLGAPIADHEQYSRDLLDALGIQHGDRKALSALTGADTVRAYAQGQKLLRAKDAHKKYGSLLINGVLGPVHGTNFLPLSIHDALADGIADDIDLMIGTVREDGRLFQLFIPGPESLGTRIVMNWFQNLLLPRRQPKLVFRRYKKVMPGASSVAIRNQIITDAMFRRGTVRAAELHAASAPGRTYLYQFNWVSPIKGIGAMHGLDLPFMTQNLEAFADIIGDVEPLRDMADIVSDAWVSFAKTGKPTAAMPEWEPFDAGARATMVFDTKIELQHDVDRALRDIWYGKEGD